MLKPKVLPQTPLSITNKQNIPILFEDEYLLVIDKPAGMVVNRAESVKGETVQGWLENNFQFSIFNFQLLRSGIVHRLDKETSGVLIIAKTPEVFAELQRQFKAREVEKTYVALVHGRVASPGGVIAASVGRLPWNRERFGVLAGGRAAETHYKVNSHYSLSTNHYPERTSSAYSLLTLTPKTGRTHQLRVHLKSIGHPIVGDQFYAGRKTARADRKWCPRLFLHAHSIKFTHPQTGKMLTINSELPEDIKKALSMM